MSGARFQRILWRFGVLASCLAAAPLHAQSVQVSRLSDLDFGAISSFAADLSLNESLCAYSTVLLGKYSVTATGSGQSGAFSLQSGSAQLPYDVQWNATAGQTSGTMLTAGIPLTGQTSGAVVPNCITGLTASGSLIVTLRSSDLASATAGNYTGTLTILLVPN